MIGIYKFTNKFNGKIYVGQSKDIKARYHAHMKELNGNTNTRFYDALRHYGEAGFNFEVIMECPLNELDYWEKYYIKYYSSNNPEYGYNMNEGGCGQQNMDAETAHKISIGNKEYYSHQENRDNVSTLTRQGMKKVPREKLQTQLGKPRSEETRKKIGNTLRGTKKPEGFGEHLSEVLSGRKPSETQLKHMSDAAQQLCWVTNEVDDLRINKSELEHYISLGYRRGRKKFSKEHIMNLSSSHKKL